ncbi:MAG: radical SAM protein, partial [Desulfurococcales archaeon]|nr:radical SAM protein [Desulfurococcales archaeon]
MNERTLGTPERGVYSKPWMPRGCELCYPGSKAVIFVTGLCDDSCYYCPVSRERLGKDVFQVNERRVSSVYEVVEEIERAGAQGASITGGDPLVKASRTIEVIRVLKEVFGRRFHIHLYTSGRYAGSSLLARLAEAGLDEIRFHPTRPGFIEAASRAKRVGSWSVGFEIPVAPALKEWAWEIVLKAEELGVEFVNLNEMEVTQDNINDIIMKG